MIEKNTTYGSSAKVSEFDGTQKELEASLSALQERVHTLSSRLSPVLTDAVNASPNKMPEPIPSQGSLLLRFLRNMVYMVRLLNAQIDEINQRLEL